MARKISAKIKKPVARVSLELTLSDLKKITAGGSSFGGDTWQQIKWEDRDRPPADRGASRQEEAWRPRRRRRSQPDRWGGLATSERCQPRAGLILFSTTHLPAGSASAFDERQQVRRFPLRHSHLVGRERDVGVFAHGPLPGVGRRPPILLAQPLPEASWPFVARPAGTRSGRNTDCGRAARPERRPRGARCARSLGSPTTSASMFCPASGARQRFGFSGSGRPSRCSLRARKED